MNRTALLLAFLIGVVGNSVCLAEQSGWGPDSLRTLLDMRDGSDYTEDYPDFSTTFRIQDCAIGWTDADYCPENGPNGLYEFLPTIGRNEAKVGKFSYRSGSTNVIGWVLEEATGQPLAELISTHIWKPMGAEYDANITVDAGGRAGRPWHEFDAARPGSIRAAGAEQRQGIWQPGRTRRFYRGYAQSDRRLQLAICCR
jgi:CubicO group peptidase (beta-lactamase class C family)